MRNDEVLKADQQLIADALKIRFYPMTVKAANGIMMTDHEDKQYIDLSAGWAVMNIGYGHERIKEQLMHQYDQLSFTTQLSVPDQKMVKLAEKLTDITPASFEQKVWFGHSGSDANDCIAKLVPLANNRSRMISFMGGMHGQTLGSMALSGHTSQARFVSSGNFIKVPFPNPYRPPFGDAKNLSDQVIQFIENEVFTSISPSEETAGIVVEGIQSDGGMIVPPDDFLPKLQALCNKHQIYLILDEVKVGMGRTGKWYSFNHMDVEPDAVVVGKSLGGGLPISAVIARKEMLDMPATHFFTTAGNPLSSSAALENLKVIEEEDLMMNVNKTAPYFMEQLYQLQERFECIGDVRGKGLAIGIELVEDRHTKTPANTKTAAVCYRAYELGLMMFYVGLHSNVIEITPPLTMSKEDVDRSMMILEQAFKDLEDKNIDMNKVKNYAGW